MDVITLKKNLESLFPDSTVELSFDRDCQVSIELPMTEGKFNFTCTVVYGYVKPVVNDIERDKVKILPHRVSMPLKTVYDQLPSTPECYCHPETLRELAIILHGESMDTPPVGLPSSSDMITELRTYCYYTADQIIDKTQSIDVTDDDAIQYASNLQER